jgi:hypothetical protein
VAEKWEENIYICNICYYEVMGSWKKLHKEKLHNMYSSACIIIIIKLWRMRWAGACSTNGEKRNTCRLLVGKPKGKRPLGRP